MDAPSDRPDARHRRARFAVPPPVTAIAGSADRLRLVDPTGCAVAWLGYGEALVVLGVFVQEADGRWREVLRDALVDVGASPQGWTLVERDPTMARLRCDGGDEAFEVIAAMAEGALTIERDGTLLLEAGPT
jgi:hypothetical protein